MGVFEIIISEILCPYKNSGLIENYSHQNFPAMQYTIFYNHSSIKINGFLTYMCIYNRNCTSLSMLWLVTNIPFLDPPHPFLTPGSAQWLLPYAPSLVSRHFTAELTVVPLHSFSLSLTPSPTDQHSLCLCHPAWSTAPGLFLSHFHSLCVQCNPLFCNHTFIHCSF